MGFAVTPALALLAAREAAPLLVARDSAAFAAALPVAALEPPPPMREVLVAWGIRTVGQWLALGRDQVAERLGPEAVALFDRVSVNASRPLKLVTPPEEVAERMEFESAVETIEPLLFVVRRFVEQLARRFELVHLVVGEFQLRLDLASGVKYERVFTIPAPTVSVETLFRMLQTHLETVRTDSPIIALRLGAKPCRAETHQFGLFETSLRDPNQFAETLARLTALCGADRVGTPELEPSHRPDAFKMKTPDFGGEVKPTGPDTAPVRGLQLRRFRPPVAAGLEFRERRPVGFRSPIFSGAVIDVRGPFVSSGDWWDDGRWAREEWDVQTAGGALYRIFRSAGGGFVEGIYD
jgi:protein ImuB